MDNLANILRPQTLSEVVGQNHLRPFLKKIVESSFLPSLILYGPPGIGKTSLAFALLKDLKLDYGYFNAATNSKAELVKLIEISQAVIIDEIHRLNRDKQDILTIAIESEKVKIIVTTTENPYFVINPAIRSRCQILELRPLEIEEIYLRLLQLIATQKINLNISKPFLKIIVRRANGDLRTAFNICEILSQFYQSEKVTKKALLTLIPHAHLINDKDGDRHYDLLSAFHKSLRGSDADAALYYFAQLIASQDLLALERRMIMATYEDVGLASSQLGTEVLSAIDCAKRVGFPEARIILAKAIIAICQAPKSNSAYLAIQKAQNYIETGDVLSIPQHLQDNHYPSAKKLHRGQGYQYPHDFDENLQQSYLPKEIVNMHFYIPKKTDTFWKNNQKKMTIKKEKE